MKHTPTIKIKPKHEAFSIVTIKDLWECQRLALFGLPFFDLLPLLPPPLNPLPLIPSPKSPPLNPFP